MWRKQTSMDRSFRFSHVEMRKAYEKAHYRIRHTGLSFYGNFNNSIYSQVNGTTQFDLKWKVLVKSEEVLDILFIDMLTLRIQRRNHKRLAPYDTHYNT